MLSRAYTPCTIINVPWGARSGEGFIISVASFTAVDDDTSVHTRDKVVLLQVLPELHSLEVGIFNVPNKIYAHFLSSVSAFVTCSIPSTMDIQRSATGVSRDPDHGKVNHNYEQENPSLGSDQRDMWRMGKAQELRVRSWWIYKLLEARLTANSDTSVPGQLLVFQVSWGARGNTC